MAVYIEREALEVVLNHRLNFLLAEYGEYDHYTSGFDEAVTRVENFPSADVAPVRYGRWDEGHEMMTCTNCCEQFDLYFKNDFNYCPNCGAKMDEG